MTNQENPNMNEEQDSSNKKFNYEDCYRIAIEERARHQQNYNHWMNMYAIFNGALLVAFTAIPRADNEFLILLITLLGVITSTLWCFSVHGYYDWIISWINVVSFYESKLKNGNESVYIYRLFAKTKSKFPFSTQKCTLYFTKCVLISWIFTFLYQIISVFKSKNISIRECICENVCVLIFLILFITVCIFCSSELRENLKDTHKNLTKIKISNSKRLNSELQSICDFEEQNNKKN